MYINVDHEKTRVIDAFLALKNVTVTSGDAGSSRADYDSFCDQLGLEGYERNLYDFYVEAHANAFVSMQTPEQEHHRMAHTSGERKFTHSDPRVFGYGKTQNASHGLPM